MVVSREAPPHEYLFKIRTYIPQYVSRIKTRSLSQTGYGSTTSTERPAEVVCCLSRLVLFLPLHGTNHAATIGMTRAAIPVCTVGRDGECRSCVAVDVRSVLIRTGFEPESMEVEAEETYVRW